MALDGADLGSWDWDLVTGESFYDERWLRMLEIPPSDARGTSALWEERIHPEDREAVLRACRDHIEGRTAQYETTHRLRTESGSWVWVLSRGRVIERDGTGRALRFCGTHLDVTGWMAAEAARRRDEARLRSLANILQYRGSRRDFLDFALAEALAMTESRVGYLYFYDEERRILHINTWSAEVMGQCRVADPSGSYRLEETGIWGEVIRQRRPVIMNDFAAPHPLKRGYPEGHVPLTTYLAIPVFSGDHIVATLGVANRPGPYDETDAHQLALLMEAVWRVVERRTAEDALAESESMLRAVFDRAPEAIAIQSNGRFALVNPAAMTLLGAERPEQLIGMEFVDRLHPAYRELVRRRIELLDVHRQQVPALDEVYLRLDGSEVDVHVSVVPFLYKGSNGALVFLQDITGRKRVEDALRSSESLHRALLGGIPDSVARFDLEGRHLFLSRPTDEISEGEPSRYIGRTHEELGFPADTCRFWRESIAQVCGTGSPLESERTVESPTGTRSYNTRLIPELNARGLVQSVLSITRDITDHRRAERDYRTLFREMLDGFALHEIICDRTGKPVDYRFLAVNPAFERQTGFTAAQVIGRTALEMIPHLESSWIERYGRVALTGVQESFTDRAESLGRVYEVTAFRPSPGQFACIFSDVTRRREAETEREKLAAQLAQSQKMESVGRLAGGVAHDFNNMLSVILGHAGLALDSLTPAHPLYEPLLEIQRAAQRSADLTRRLLAFARKQTITPQVLDLNATVQTMLAMLKRLIGEDIELSWQPRRDLWLVHVDPSQIDQILANLCVNARDAIAGNGRVTIETSNETIEDGPRPLPTDVEPGDYAVLAVSDNGCGMTPEVRSHLFEPFFTTKGIGKGTGLGLATVYGIMKQNAGAIRAYSEPGRGTTFRLYFPRHHGPVQAVQGGGSARPSPGGSETILLVEDEPSILRIGSRMLEGLGYTVIPAGSPGAAIRAINEHDGRIDLLLTDVVMPEMNGLELVKRLREKLPGLPAIFMSGYTANTMADHGVVEGSTTFLAKPFSLAQLSSKVRETLDREV